MNTLSSLINKIKSSPRSIEFNDVINVISEHYHYSPVLFTNGAKTDCVVNQAQKNEGSCKIFSFAQINQLSELQTLHCFGQYYREEVLNDVAGTNHGNIRAFMKHGWEHIKFDGLALTPKTR